MKQLFFTLLLTLLMSIVGANSFAHDIEATNSDGKTIYYSWFNNKTELEVSYRGSSSSSYSDEYSGNVVIPASVKYNGITYSVTSIGNRAFYECSSLVSVTIPSSVKSIGTYAFYKCSSLASATIPSGVVSIGGGAFMYCSSITSVTIPPSVTSIDYTAFAYCSNLTSVTISEGLTDLAVNAFNGCISLTSIKVEAGNSIYDSRDNCNAIIVTRSNTLVSGCNNTIIPSSVTSIGNVAFYECSTLTSVTIPSSVKSIGFTAFKGCSGLTSVTIPSSVTSIGVSTFLDCNNLTSVTVMMEAPTNIAPNTFSNRANATLYIPYGCKAAYESADYWKEFKEIVEMASPNIEFADANVKALCVANWDKNGDSELSESEAAAVTSLGTVFKGNTEIKSFSELQYFTGLNSINSDAFHCCSSLASVKIPNGVTDIGEYAFSWCSNLTSVVIPSSVRSIGREAFYLCSGLTSVTIPNSVTSIGDMAFLATGLTTPVYNSTLFAYLPASFSGQYCIPEGIKEICGGAFYYCDGLTSVTIPNCVTKIGNNAFFACYGLTSVTIPNSVTSIGEWAFLYCI